MFINKAIDLECLRAIGEFGSSVSLMDSSSQINYSEPVTCKSKNSEISFSEPVSCKPRNSEILYPEKAGDC